MRYVQFASEYTGSFVKQFFLLKKSRNMSGLNKRRPYRKALNFNPEFICVSYHNFKYDVYDFS